MSLTPCRKCGNNTESWPFEKELGSTCNPCLSNAISIIRPLHETLSASLGASAETQRWALSTMFANYDFVIDQITKAIGVNDIYLGLDEGGRLTWAKSKDGDIVGPHTIESKIVNFDTYIQNTNVWKENPKRIRRYIDNMIIVHLDESITRLMDLLTGLRIHYADADADDD